MRPFTTLTCLAVLGLSICGVFSVQLATSQSQPPSASAPLNRSNMLAHLARHVMLPTYVEFESAAKALQQSTTQFCDDPTRARLETTQARWKQAASRWKRSEALQLDLTRVYVQSIGYWPTRPRRIRLALVSDQPITADVVEKMGVAAHGLWAMEYLLFDAEAGPTGVL